jgi:hypothetical protein
MTVTYRNRTMVGATEIARATGTSTAAVSNWMRRHPDFPAPAIQLMAGSIWEWRAVATWLRKTRRRYTDVETGVVYNPSTSD